MKKREVKNRLALNKNVISNLESHLVKGGRGGQGGNGADAAGWLSLPKTECAECWPDSTDPFWD